MVLGNKSDLTEERVVDKAMLDAKVKELNLRSAEVSAKTGEGVGEFFKDLAATIALGDKKTREGRERKSIQQAQVPAVNNEQKQQPTVSLNNKGHAESGKQKKKGGCC